MVKTIFISLFLLVVIFAPVNAVWTLSYDSPEQGIRSLAIYNGKLYAGTENYGSVYVYDGNSWNLSYASQATVITSFAVYNGKLYAGADRGIYVYDGIMWDIVNFSPDTHPGIRSLIVYDNKLYVGSTSPIVFTYNGTSWETKFYPYFNANAFAIYNGKLYAGTYDTGIVYRYNGTSWEVSYDSRDFAISSFAVYNGKLYAGTNNKGNIYTYDGGSWVLNDLNLRWRSVSALAVYNDKLYAGGTDDAGWSVLSVYDGTSWKTNDTNILSVKSSSSQAKVSADVLTVYNGKLYAGDSLGITHGSIYETDFAQESKCDVGCADGDGCAPPGTRLTVNGVHVYCDPIKKSLEEQKNVNESCQGDYECATYYLGGQPSTCVDGVCVTITSIVSSVTSSISSSNCVDGVCATTTDATTPTPTPTPTANPTPVQCSNGCLYTDSCIPFGTRLGPQYSVIPFNGSASYCDAAKKAIEPQKNDASACQNNYECISNYCSDGVCGNLQKELAGTRGLLEQILGFLRAIFGKFFPFPSTVAK